jgi:ribonuclease BN (tRNA processing enzyme)
MIRLVILGAGTAIPVPGYSPAGYLVQIENLPLLVDIGPGTLSRLAEAGVDYRLLDTVLITHHHSDHTLDLVTLLQAYDSTPGWTRTDPLHLIGGIGTAKFYDQLMAAYPGIAPSSYNLELREITEESLDFPSWKLSTALTGHTSYSLGYRLETGGKSIVFSGDAVLTPGLVNLARQADVFICECSFPGRAAPSEHLAAEQVGWIAREAGVKRLLLVHLYPPARDADVVSQVRREFAGLVEIAYDGLEVLL